MKKAFIRKALCIGISILCISHTPLSGHAEALNDIDIIASETETSTYLLDDISAWKTGQYSAVSGKYESWSGRLCYSEDLSVLPGMVYRLSQPDNSYDIVVTQLDSNLQILSQKSYKNGSEVVMTEQTAFTRLYIYNPGNYNTSYPQYEELFANGYSICMAPVMNYSNQLHETNLTNPGLWEKGNYTAPQGETNTVSSVRMRDYKEVAGGATYSCTFSATGYSLALVQLDADKNILSSTTLRNGSECTMHNNTKFARLALTDTTDYNLSVNEYTELCTSGLEFSLDIIENYSNNIIDTNLTNIGLWESGLYNSTTGAKASGGYAIRLITLKDCLPEREYKYCTSNPDFRLSVAEYGADGTFLKMTNLKNESTFVTTSDTACLGLCISISGNYAMSYTKYAQAFQAESFLLNLALVPVAQTPQPTLPPVATEEPLPTEAPAATVSPETPVATTTPEAPVETALPETTEAPTATPYYQVMTDSIIQLSIQDASYRVLLTEYDETMQPLATTDLGNLDYHYVNANTAYVSLSVYQYENGKAIEGTDEIITSAENSYNIALLPMNDLTNDSDKAALFGPELNTASTSNVANYRYGWYKSWGGGYEYSSSGICSRNYYKITQDKYYVNINDSRISVSLREYDENGKWLKCIDSMYDGAVYTPSENTAFVTLVVKSTEWATGPFDLMGYGLVIDFSDTPSEYHTDIVPIDDFDFADRQNWRSGAYVGNTGVFGLNRYSICTTKFLSVENLSTPMMVDLWNSYLKMHILEMSADGTCIKNNTLHDGQKWTKQEETAYIGVAVSYENNYDYSYYTEQWDNGCINKLTPFEKYVYNTTMNPITAKEFMNIMNVGWNLGNSLDSHYGNRDESKPATGQERTWGNITITKELIDHIADLGFNTIRIPVTWYYNTYHDENGTLRVHEAWFDRVQDVVDYAIANDMYVFLNTHHEQPIIFTGTDEDTFAQVLSDAEDLWLEIATYFKDYDEHLIFEAYNEVDNIEQSWSYSAKSAEQMNRLNQVFVDTVRATGGNNAQRILCAPTLLDGYDSLILGDYVKPTDPAGEDYLLTQIHSYSYQFDQDIEALFASLEEFANANNLPVIIGEFGTKPGYSPIEYREEASANFVARAAKRGIKCIYWDDGNLNNYGLVNRRDFSLSEHEIIDALIHPQAYRSTNKITLDSMNSFAYMSLNQSTGELKEDKYWGTIVTDINGYGVEIPAGSDYITLNLVTTNNATLQKIHYVHFYDADMEFISAVNNGNGFYSKTLDIPENAAYVRVGINNSYTATNVLKFHKFFAFGEMKLTLGFIDADTETSVTVDPMDGSTPIIVLQPTQPEGMISLLDEVDFCDFSAYEAGSYYYSTGMKTDDSTCIRVSDYLDVNGQNGATYVYTTTKTSIRMSVIQLDADMKYLSKTELVNNKTLTLSENTKYLAITLSNPYVNYQTDYSVYQGFFENGLIITFDSQTLP